MPMYVLRDVDPDLWQKVLTKAAAEGRRLRELFVWLLELYVSDKLPPR